MARKEPEAFKAHEGHPKDGGKMDIAKHSHHDGGAHGHIPHAGHGLAPDHPMLHSDDFHLNKSHG